MICAHQDGAKAVRRVCGNGTGWLILSGKDMRDWTARNRRRRAPYPGTSLAPDASR